MSSNNVMALHYKYKPFWSVMDLGCEEYCEVEIYRDGSHVEKLKNIDESLNMRTYKCHICNIDVPRAYTKEHNQSTKHEMCLQIMNKALDRASLYMKTDSNEAKVMIEVSDTYFCEPCAVVVQNSDKDKHNVSNKHVNSVRNDELLQKLVNIYENPQLDCEEIDINLSKTDFDRGLYVSIPDFFNASPDIDTTDKHSNAIKTNDENGTAIDAPKTKSKKAKRKKKKCQNKIAFQQKSEGKKENSQNNEVSTEENYSHCQNISKKEIFDIANNLAENCINDSNNKVKAYDTEENKDKEQPEHKFNNLPHYALDASNIEVKTNNTVENKKGEANIGNKSPELVAIHNPQDNIYKNQNKENTDHSQFYKKEVHDTKTAESNANINFNELCYYLKTISNCTNYMIAAVAEDIIEVSVDKKVFRIPPFNLLGLKVIGKALVVCKLCALMTSINIHTHKWTDEHLAKVKMPLDQHGVRKINNILSHCVLCNIVHLGYETGQLHITSAYHKNKLQKCMSF